MYYVVTLTLLTHYTLRRVPLDLAVRFGSEDLLGELKKNQESNTNLSKGFGLSCHTIYNTITITWLEEKQFLVLTGVLALARRAVENTS